jgi:hypothetical protein
MRAPLMRGASTAGAALPVLGATGAGAADAGGAARTALRASPLIKVGSGPCPARNET